MNIKLLAAIDTLKLILAAVIGAGAAHLALIYISVDTLLMGVGLTALALMIYVFYGINLSRRTYQKLRDESSDKS